MEPIKLIPVYFFKEDSGKEPVKEWLRGFPVHERKIIGRDIRIVQIDWPIGPPLIKSLGLGLWEVRSRLDNRIVRVIFIFHKGAMILLHGFVKKSQKTPTNDLSLAQKRAKKFLVENK